MQRDLLSSIHSPNVPQPKAGTLVWVSHVHTKDPLLVVQPSTPRVYTSRRLAQIEGKDSNPTKCSYMEYSWPKQCVTHYQNVCHYLILFYHIVFHCLHIPQSIHTFIEEHLGCIYVLTIINKTTSNSSWIFLYGNTFSAHLDK